MEFQTIPDVSLPAAPAVVRSTATVQVPNAVTVSPSPSRVVSSRQVISPLLTVREPVKIDARQPNSQTTPIKGKATIACIDDSPVLAHTLKKILVSAGYEVLIIQEPMRGFTQLIEHQPSLILLDLMLPNADGYSVCKFLRDTPIFEKTPIIILTGQNKPIDRARARLAGATSQRTF